MNRLKRLKVERFFPQLLGMDAEVSDFPSRRSFGYYLVIASYGSIFADK